MPVDWEDHQSRPEPHSTLNTSAAGASIPASPNTLDVTIGTMKAYRSVRVSVDPGARDIDVTVYWTFDGSAAGILTFETQTVKGGETTALLFRSQGHNLDQVSFASVGGTSTIDYEIAGSNLDPLPPSGAALDLPWAAGEADLRSNGNRATYFLTATSDSNLFAYDSANKQWLIFEAGTYLYWTHALFQDGVATTPAATRFSFASVFDSVGGGHSFMELLNHPLQVGVLEFSGTSARWDLNESEIISLDPSHTPMRISTTAACSSGANLLLGMTMGIVRISTSALDNPF